MATVKITISIPEEIKETAHEYGINISKAATAGIETAIEREKKIKELGL